MGESRLSAGTLIHLDERPDLRGEVTQITESLITVTFEAPVDFSRIPQLGAFVASPNTTAPDKQAETIELLREGRRSATRSARRLICISYKHLPVTSLRNFPGTAGTP
jgi:hypothetical protein